MAATIIKDTAYDSEGGVVRRVELLIGSSSDLATAPAVAPGSIAYTADMSYMALYDGTQWVQLGGGGD